MFFGETQFPLTLIAASQLHRYRLVTIIAGVPAYASAGGRVDGVTRAIGDENDYAVAVYPISKIDRTFFVEAAGAIAAHGAAFATTDGKVIGKLYDVFNRSEQDVPDAPATGRYLVPAAGWSSEADSADKIAYYDGAAWTYTAAVEGNVLYIAQEDKYVIFNGTAWVDAQVIGYSSEVAVDGQTIALYNYGQSEEIRRDQLPSELNPAAKIVAAGLSDAETDDDSEVVVLDARIAATDIALVTLKAAGNAVYVTKAACTAGTLTVTLSGNGGAGTVVNYTILRSLDS